MTPGPDSPSPRLLRALYALVLRLYPQHFRRRYREAMFRGFDDRCRLAHRRAGLPGLVLEVGALLVDAAANGVGERLADRDLLPTRGPNMSALLHDLRTAVRSLLARPTAAVVILATLTLAIGANTLVFGVVDAVLLEPLPYPESGRLAVVWEEHPGRGRDAASIPDYLDWRRGSELARAIAAYEWWGLAYTDADEPLDVSTLRTTGGLLELLGVPPLLGRTFLPAEEASGAAVVVLGHAFWQDVLEGDPGIVGAEIRLDLQPYTVVGVMPAGFAFPPSAAEQPRLFVPMPTDALAARPGARGARRFLTIARLQDGVTAEALEDELGGIARRLQEEHPDSNDGWGVAVEPAHEALVVNRSRSTLLVLFGTVALLLLIGCANVANVMLARLGTRRREIAVRAALGARRSRILRPVLLEALLLALGGGLLGVGLARLGVGWLRDVPATYLPRLQAVDLDGTVLAFTFACSLAVGLAFGLGPALRAARLEPMSGLAGGPSSRHRPGLLPDGIVVAQVALTAVVLVGAGLLGRSLYGLASVDPGFDPDNVLASQIYLLEPLFPEERDQVRFYERLLDDLRAHPDVVSAGAASEVPLSYYGIGFTLPLESDEWVPPPSGQERRAVYKVATPGYFETLGVRLLRGRLFDDRDREDGPRTMLVNETLARRYFGDAAALGARASIPVGGAHEIVGVVADQRSGGLEAPPRPELYIPLRQNPRAAMVVVARTRGDAATLAPELRAAVAGIEPEQPVNAVHTLEGLVADSLLLPRLAAALSGAFGVLALSLAVIGVYGVLSFAVSRQAHEIGIRQALGARPGQTARRVVGRGMTRVLVGAAAGLLAAFLASRVVAGALHGVDARDPWVFGGVAAVLIGVGFTAALVPALRAARVDPLVALRRD